MEEKSNPVISDALMARLMEQTGVTSDLEEAIDQWDLERKALAELFDQNEAYDIYFHRIGTHLELVGTMMGLVNEMIAGITGKGTMFLDAKVVKSIERFRKRMKEYEESEKRINRSMENIRNDLWEDIRKIKEEIGKHGRKDEGHV